MQVTTSDEAGHALLSVVRWEAHLIFERGGSPTGTAGKWRFSGKREPERFP